LQIQIIKIKTAEHQSYNAAYIHISYSVNTNYSQVYKYQMWVNI